MPEALFSTSARTQLIHTATGQREQGRSKIGRVLELFAISRLVWGCLVFALTWSSAVIDALP